MKLSSLPIFLAHDCALPIRTHFRAKHRAEMPGDFRRYKLDRSLGIFLSPTMATDQYQCGRFPIPEIRCLRRF
jgi:hypothetical protein